MKEKKEWISPKLEVISLETEDDVLNACFTSSQGARGGQCKHQVPKCALV